MQTARIATIHAVAKHRKPGYLAACLNAGRRNGEWLEWPDDVHQALRARFQISNLKSEIPNSAPCPRLGDCIHKIAGPIGLLLHWPCLKGGGTTDLRPGSPCARIQARLNTIKLPHFPARR
jgi:hypothetical protein